MNAKFENIRNILLVEEDPRDVELILPALDEFDLAGNVVVNDRAQPLVSPCRRRNSNRARAANPPWCCLTPGRRHSPRRPRSKQSNRRPVQCHSRPPLE
jgi:hypothetical protein